MLFEVSVCAALAVGFTNIHIETDFKAMWNNSESDVMKNMEKVDALFHLNQRVNQFLVLDKDEGSSVLSKKVFDSYWELHECLMSVASYSKVCHRPYPDAPEPYNGCLQLSPLDFFANNRTYYAEMVRTDADVRSHINDVHNAGVYPGKPLAVDLRAVFGNVVLDSGSQLISAPVTGSMHFFPKVHVCSKQVLRPSIVSKHGRWVAELGVTVLPEAARRPHPSATASRWLALAMSTFSRWNTTRCLHTATS